MFKKDNATRIHLIVMMVIVAGIILCYRNTTEVPFVFDDRTSIVENPKIKDLNKILSVKSLTAQRPLTDLTFWLNYRFGGLDVYGYHLVNMLIHILAAMLTYILAFQIFLQLMPQHKYSELTVHYCLAAGFTSIVFALHPIQTQAVTYIVQRYTSMAGFFYLFSVLLYVFGRKAMLSNSSKTTSGIHVWGTFCPLKSIIFFAFSFFFALGGFLSKQSAISLPLAILLVEYTMFDRTWAGWKKKIFYMAPFLVSFVIFIFYSTGVFHGDMSLARLLEETDQRARETQAVTRAEYLLTQFKVIPIYLGLMVWPVNQNIDYMYPFVSNLFQSWTIWGLLIILSMAGLGIWVRKIMPIIFLGIFWFFITLSVESGVVPIRDALFEHRLYLPMFGFALILGWGFGLVYMRWKIPALILGMIILTLFGAMTYKRNLVWQDPVLLWADSISKNPTNYRAQYNYGLELAKKGNIQQALEHFLESIRLYPGFAKAHHNAGLAYQFLKNADLAIKHYRLAVKYDPSHTKARLNISVILASRGNFGGAQEELKAILEVDPQHMDALMNLSVIYYNKGRVNEAFRLIDRALALAPARLNLLINKGIMLMEQERIDEAESFFLKAYEINPEDRRIIVQLNRLRQIQAIQR